MLNAFLISVETTCQKQIICIRVTQITNSSICPSRICSIHSSPMPLVAFHNCLQAENSNLNAYFTSEPIAQYKIQVRTSAPRISTTQGNQEIKNAHVLYLLCNCTYSLSQIHRISTFQLHTNCICNHFTALALSYSVFTLESPIIFVTHHESQIIPGHT